MRGFSCAWLSARVLDDDVRVGRRLFRRSDRPSARPGFSRYDARVAPEQSLNPAPPVGVDAHLDDFDRRIKIAKQLAGTRVKPEGGRDQVEQGRSIGQLAVGKIASVLKLWALEKPPDAKPVVEPV